MTKKANRESTIKRKLRYLKHLCGTLEDMTSQILNNFNICLSYVSTDGGSRKLRYRVHRFDIDMRKDQRKLEQFLNGLEGEVVAIIPSVNPKYTVRGATATVYFLLIVEKSE